jgi:D-serine deaminase-like pyridoxal phosphate-dependent protein
MRTIDQLDSPAVLVDLDVVERNISTMAKRAEGLGVELRPHAKTHKTVEIGRKQLQAGAVGLSVAKVGEAEVFADAGFEDIFVAYPVIGAQKARRLLGLAERIRLLVGVDSVEGATGLAAPFQAAGRELEVRLKVDVGFHRVGVAPDKAVETARRIAEVPGLRLEGIFTHAGQSYRADSPEAVAEVGRHEGETMVEVARQLAASGIGVTSVSVGSTPTAPHAMKVSGVTECRPGNYVYHDATQVSLGTCRRDDCAMTVLATVVSTPAPDRAVIDAGSKTLASDPLRPGSGGFGWIQGGSSHLARLSEEHGVIEVAEADRYAIGDRVRVLPNHACVVSNLHDRVYGVRGEGIEAELAVAARGRVS